MDQTVWECAIDGVIIYYVLSFDLLSAQCLSLPRRVNGYQQLTNVLGVICSEPCLEGGGGGGE